MTGEITTYEIQSDYTLFPLPAKISVRPGLRFNLKAAVIDERFDLETAESTDRQHPYLSSHGRDLRGDVPENAQVHEGGADGRPR